MRAWGLQGAEGGDGIGKGGVGLHSKLRPASGSQVLNHEPQSGVVLFPKVCSANDARTAACSPASYVWS